MDEWMDGWIDMYFAFSKENVVSQLWFICKHGEMSLVEEAVGETPIAISLITRLFRFEATVSERLRPLIVPRWEEKDH